MSCSTNKRLALICSIISVFIVVIWHKDIAWSRFSCTKCYDLLRYDHKKTISNIGDQQHNDPSRDAIRNETKIIHIVTSCSGSPTLVTLTTFIKSLLFFRTNYIHLHVITNSTTKASIDTLLSTWNIKDFNHTTYVRPNKDPDFGWIPYSHGAGHYGFQKLIVHEILSKKIERVIFYDVDIVLLRDISELWREFSKFSPTQAIGMGAETQFWYNAGVKEAWPALHWGYNGGLLLLDLHKLRNIPFREMYTESTKEMLKRMHEAHLAEQDMLNYLFVRNPNIIYTLPCHWNVQFGPRSNSKACKIEEALDIKGLHTTIPKLNQAKWDPRLSVYKEIVGTFNNMNGNKYSSNPVKHRIFPYTISTDSVLSSDVTLVVHMPVTDWRKLNDFLLKWKGIMCLLIFGDDTSIETMHMWPVRENVSYYFVYLNEGETSLQTGEMESILSEIIRTDRYIITGARKKIPLNFWRDFRNSNNGKWGDFVIETVRGLS